MNIIDIIIIIVLAFGFVLGFLRGFTKELVNFLGLFVVLILSFILKNLFLTSYHLLSLEKRHHPTIKCSYIIIPNIYSYINSICLFFY